MCITLWDEWRCGSGMFFTDEVKKGRSIEPEYTVHYIRIEKARTVQKVVLDPEKRRLS